MSEAALTLQSFVNTWEADENGHLNVQFYCQHFQEAESHFALACGLDDKFFPRPNVRHIRYHSELFPNEIIRIVTGFYPNGPYPTTIVHALYESITGRLSASALDGFEAPPEEIFNGCALSSLPVMPPDTRFMPRSTPLGVASFLGNVEQRLAQGAIHSNRRVMMMADCDHQGLVTDRAMVNSFSNGAPNIWLMAGLAEALSNQDGIPYGRVAVEMKLSRFTPLKAGDPLQMVTGFSDLHAKSFRFRHDIYNARNAELAMAGEVTALLIDSKSRKVVALPEKIHRKIYELLQKMRENSV